MTPRTPRSARQSTLQLSWCAQETAAQSSSPRVDAVAHTGTPGQPHKRSSLTTVCDGDDVAADCEARHDREEQMIMTASASKRRRSANVEVR